jgi:hypothetical protein
LYRRLKGRRILQQLVSGVAESDELFEGQLNLPEVRLARCLLVGLGLPVDPI